MGATRQPAPGGQRQRRTRTGSGQAPKCRAPSSPPAVLALALLALGALPLYAVAEQPVGSFFAPVRRGSDEGITYTRLVDKLYVPLGYNTCPGLEQHGWLRLSKPVDCKLEFEMCEQPAGGGGA